MIVKGERGSIERGSRDVWWVEVGGSSFAKRFLEWKKLRVVGGGGVQGQQQSIRVTGDR
jgi:hypothetical protein